MLAKSSQKIEQTTTEYQRVETLLSCALGNGRMDIPKILIDE